MLTVNHKISIVESCLALYSPGRSYSIYVSKWVTRLSQLPSPANFSYIFLQNLTNCLHEKQKGWLVEKGDSPSLVILLWWLGHPHWRANFSPYKHFWLGQPGQLGEGEMIRACASAVGAGKGCTILWYKWPVHDLVLVIPPPPLNLRSGPIWAVLIHSL